MPSRRDAPALPAEIAFLLGSGISPALLSDAAKEANRVGMRADLALLASGRVSEANYYRALAAHLGMAFLARPVSILSPLSAPSTIAAGIAALAPNAAGWTHVHAPRGEAVVALLNERRNRAAHAPRLVIATPRAFAALVRASHADDIQSTAAGRLAQEDASYSACTGLTNVQWALCAAFGFPVGGLVGLAPAVLGLAAGIIFLIAIGVRLAATLTSPRPARGACPPTPDDRLPTYTILVPLYREARMVRSIVGALDRLDYPKARLDIVILLEADDPETLRELTALRLPARYSIVVGPPGHPRTKPRALNIGLQFARGSLITVFDAEDEPEPDQLRIAAARFAHEPLRVACLQARLAVHNHAASWLARLFAIEYCALFDVINPGQAWLRLPILLGGTSNHFRTAALRLAGGWDAWNVTEDADLGVRLARFGYGVRMLDSTTHEEAPEDLATWLKQRSRWFKGWMQTVAVQTRSMPRLVREVGVVRSLACLATLCGTILGALFGPLFMTFASVEIINGNLFRPVSLLDGMMAAIAFAVLILGTASAVLPILVGLRRRRYRALWPSVALLPAYYLLLTVAAWWALFEVSTNAYHWAKTEHGLGRHARVSERDG